MQRNRHRYINAPRACSREHYARLSGLVDTEADAASEQYIEDGQEREEEEYKMFKKACDAELEKIKGLSQEFVQYCKTQKHLKREGKSDPLLDAEAEACSSRMHLSQWRIQIIRGAMEKLEEITEALEEVEDEIERGKMPRFQKPEHRPEHILRLGDLERRVRFLRSEKNLVLSTLSAMVVIREQPPDTELDALERWAKERMERLRDRELPEGVPDMFREDQYAAAALKYVQSMRNLRAVSAEVRRARGPMVGRPQPDGSTRYDAWEIMGHPNPQNRPRMVGRPGPNGSTRYDAWEILGRPNPRNSSHQAAR